jgi:hypothetical protein
MLGAMMAIDTLDHLYRHAHVGCSLRAGAFNRER